MKSLLRIALTIVLLAAAAWGQVPSISSVSYVQWFDTQWAGLPYARPIHGAVVFIKTPDIESTAFLVKVRFMVRYRDGDPEREETASAFVVQGSPYPWNRYHTLCSVVLTYSPIAPRVLGVSVTPLKRSGDDITTAN